MDSLHEVPKFRSLCQRIPYPQHWLKTSPKSNSDTHLPAGIPTNFPALLCSYSTYRLPTANNKKRTMTNEGKPLSNDEKSSDDSLWKHKFHIFVRNKFDLANQSLRKKTTISVFTGSVMTTGNDNRTLLKLLSSKTPS